MMKTWLICIAFLLILSFLTVYMLIPGNNEYLDRFSDDNYITVASLDAPDKEKCALHVSSRLPMQIKIGKKETERIEISMNKYLPARNLEYLKTSIKTQLSNRSADGREMNLEITVPMPFIYLRGETFSVIGIFEQSKKILDDINHPEIKIDVPENFQVITK